MYPEKNGWESYWNIMQSKIKINENGKERFVALHRGKLVNQSDIEILARYNAEVRGLYNYYAIANDSFKIADSPIL